MSNNNVLSSEKLLFLKRFIASPSKVGSVIPSSYFLAKKMVKKSELSLCKNVAELGAGTGIFTERIINNLPSKCNFYIFEKDTHFARLLQDKFPETKIYYEAANIGELVRDGEIGNPDLIISGIPFTVLPTHLRKRILSEAHRVLPEAGKFITFQYSIDLYKELKEMYSKVDLEFVPLNIPPAFVYRCTK